jgi:hypothetical protein
MNREDTWIVRVSVDGRDLGPFDKASGGAGDSEETKYRANGGREVTLGGAQTLENVTVSVLYEEGVHALYHWLMSRRGRATMVVTKTPTDADGNVFGRSIVYTGKLKAVTPPDVDSESSDAALIELEQSTERMD